MAERSLFLSYVHYAFKNWPGLQFAILAGMGEPYSKEKAEWMEVQVENYFKLYDDVNPGDLEDYIGDMLENEFDTYCEDGSLQDLCVKLCKAYELSISNPNDEIFRKAREENSCLSQRHIPNTSSKPDEQVTPVAMEMETLNVNEEEAGWTTVTSRHKRH